MRIAHQGSGVQRQAVIDQTIGKPGRDTKIKIKNLNSIVKEEHGSRNGMFPQPLEPIAAVIHLFGNEPDLALATRAFSSSAM